MSYLGTPIDTTNQFQSLSSKQFNGDGGTTDFTLDIAPGSVNDIEVFVGNVRQDPHSAYTLSGTTLSFTGAPPTGTNNIYVVHQAKAVSTITPATNTVTNDMLVGSIANSKLANSSITLNGSAVSLGGSASVGKALGITTRTVISQNLTSSTSFSQISDWNTSYTIQEVGSKIHIRLCGSVRNDGGGSGSRRQSIKINYHQNGGSDTTLINRDLGNGQGENGFVNLEGVFTATSTGACSISVYHKTNTSGDTVRLISEFGISGQTGFLTVTEYGT